MRLLCAKVITLLQIGILCQVIVFPHVDLPIVRVYTISMDKIIYVGYHKGEMDFGVSGVVRDLSYEQMTQLRAMLCVAIGQAESMWRDSKPNPASQEIKEF